MHLIDQIGPILGIVAFLGLAILAFLIFLEAREVRRLREWAGRAPARAAEAAEAALASAEVRGEEVPVEKPGLWRRFRNGLAAFRGGLSDRLGPPLRAVDRRLPIAPRYLFALLALAAVAAAVLTSGFGIVGGGKGKGGGQDGVHGQKVAVLNGTQEPGVSAVSGLAEAVAKQVVKPKGYKPGPVADAPASVSQTVVMFQGGKRKADAKALATAVQPKLGQTGTEPMTGTVQSVARKARLALVIGLDDAQFGQSGGQ